MSRGSNATGHDESSEKDKNETKRNVAALTNKPQQRKGDREVGDGNQRVGDDVQPHQSRIPEIAVAMGHEIAGAEELPKKIHDPPEKDPVVHRDAESQRKRKTSGGVNPLIGK
jgi:hypothetical protein